MKKGQLKIQEMAFVLVGVIVLMALVMLFFVAFQSREASKNAAYYREARAITLVEMIASMPELRCSSSFSSTSESVCLDYDKVVAFNSSPTLQNRYSILWENSFVSKIEVEEIYINHTNYRTYGSIESTKTFVLYSKPTTQSTRSYSTYSALCLDDPSGSTCRIAKIRATIIMPKNS